MYFLTLAIFIINGLLPCSSHEVGAPFCDVHRLERDKEGEVQYIELEYQTLVRFTPDEMVKYMRSTPLVKMEVKISKKQKKWILTLRGTIHSSQADKFFGGIDSEHDIRLRMINGSSVYPEVVKVNDPSKIKTSGKGEKRYIAEFSLTEKMVKSLRKWELDEIGVFWKKGFEAYDVREVGLLQDQIECISKIK